MRLGWLLPILGILDSATAWPADHYRYIGKPDADVYFGHISYCELKDDGLDPRILRGEGNAEEVAALNTPILAGDAIVTPAGRRCEVQFDTGTVVRLDADTTLRVETILAPALTTRDRLTNLVIERGRVYVLYRHYDRREVFQVLAPRAAVKMRHSAVAAVEQTADGATALEVARGSAQVLYGARAEKSNRHKANARQRLVVGRDHVLRGVTGQAGVLRGDFGTWNQWMNDHFLELHQGKSLLPKPLERDSRAIHDFSQRWSGVWGEWVWADLHGYVWRPYANADTGWRPYLHGHWVMAHSDLFWVPDEPWGWVPHHLGFWTWHAKNGWVWVPGSLFAPAWVVRDVCNGYLAWRPWGYWDIDRVPGSLCPQDALPSPSEEGRVEARVSPSPPPGDRPLPERPVPERPRRRKPDDTETHLAAALAAGDPNLREAVEMVRKSPVLLRPEHLPIRRVDEAGLEGATRRDTTEGATRSGPPREVHFRDWNPDVREAARVGGTISYSSRDNAVRCDGCRVELSRDHGWGDGSSTSDASGSNSDTSASQEYSGVDRDADGGRDAGGGREREERERPEKP